MVRSLTKTAAVVSIFMATTACAEDKIELQPSAYQEGGWQRVSAPPAVSTTVPAMHTAVPMAKVISGTVRVANVVVPSKTVVQENTGLEISGAARLVEDYFNGLGALQADFVQDVSGEAPQKGIFTLTARAVSLFGNTHTRLNNG
jgi:hypothetical protein